MRLCVNVYVMFEGSEDDDWGVSGYCSSQLLDGSLLLLLPEIQKQTIITLYSVHHSRHVLISRYNIIQYTFKLDVDLFCKEFR